MKDVSARIEIAASDLDRVQIKNLLSRANVDFLDMPRRSLDADTAQFIYSLVVPVTLATVQIIADYLMSRSEERKSGVSTFIKPDNFRIRVNGKDVPASKFSVDYLKAYINIKT